MYQVPLRFVSMTAFQPFTLKSIAACGNWPPLLLTSCIEAPVAIEGGGDHRLHLLRIANRHRVRADLAAQQPADATRGFLELLRPPAADHHFGPEARKQVSDAAANAGAAAGDHEDLAGQQVRAEDRGSRCELFVGHAPLRAARWRAAGA